MTSETHRFGILAARPQAVSADAATGLMSLGLGDDRDGVVYVPPDYGPESPSPFVLMLHGAGGTGRNALSPLQDEAAKQGVILLAPDARLATWDLIMADYGPDVAFIDRALQQVFSRYAIDTSRLGIGGFSDGASYALSLGLTNGDLFTHVIAFSPGFMTQTRLVGRPHIFISHGTRDPTLPISVTSRRIVPELRRNGYDVTHVEFPGGHAVPADIARDAANWFEASAPHPA